MPTEIVPNTFPSLFWGYSVVFILLAAYLYTLGRKVSLLEKKEKTE